MMKPPPSDIQWPDKPKNRANRSVVTGLGCLLALAMLGAGLLLGVMGSIIGLPYVFNFNATQTLLAIQASNLDETAIALVGEGLALDLTADANQFARTQIALDSQGTRAALDQSRALLDQTATQSARLISATRTADAASSIQQMTQVALDYSATQARLQQNATQVELDFQATNAALNRSATQINQSGDASVQTVATPAPDLLAFFELMPPPDQWRQRQDAWVSDGGGLRAELDQAWLLRRAIYGTQYQYSIILTPALQAQADYYVLLNHRDEGPSLALRLTVNSLSLQSVSLNRYEGQDLLAEALRPELLSPIETVTVNAALGGATEISVIRNEGRFELLLDGQTLFSSDLASASGELLTLPGELGLQFPQGARLDSLQIRTDLP